MSVSARSMKVLIESIDRVSSWTSAATDRRRVAALIPSLEHDDANRALMGPEHAARRCPRRVL